MRPLISPSQQMRLFSRLSGKKQALSAGIDSQAGHTREAAYSSEVSALLTFRLSARCPAASAFSLLYPRLQRKHEARCQRVLTVEIEGLNCVLDARKRCVGLESLSNVFCTLRATNIAARHEVPGKTAGNGKTKWEPSGAMSKGIDSKAGGMRAHT